MRSNTVFALEIASLNAVGLITTLASATFVDARLTSFPVYGARTYTYGYLSCSLALPLFLVTFFSLRRPHPLVGMIVIPSLALLVGGAGVLPLFRPEFPHGAIAFWIPLYALVSAASVWIRHSPLRPAYIFAPSISARIKLERLKESATLWRTISTSLAFGYIAALFPWTKFFWDYAPQMVTRPEEVQLLAGFAGLQLGLFSLYVLLAVICEAFRRTSLVADLMLAITDHDGSV